MSEFWEQATQALPGAYQQAYSQAMDNYRQRRELEDQQRKQRLKQMLDRAEDARKRIEEQKKQHEKMLAETKKASEQFKQQTAIMKIANKRLEPHVKSGAISNADYEAIMNDIQANPNTAGSYVSRIIDNVTKTKEAPKQTEAELKRFALQAYGNKPINDVPTQFREWVVDYQKKIYPEIHPADRYGMTAKGKEAFQMMMGVPFQPKKKPETPPGVMTPEKEQEAYRWWQLRVRGKKTSLPFEEWLMQEPQLQKFGFPRSQFLNQQANVPTPTDPQSEAVSRIGDQAERQATPEQEQAIADLEKQLRELEAKFK